KTLDLGAGDGFATLRFLALGAMVTAVDISEKQLETLRQRASGSANLKLDCQDIFDALRALKLLGEQFDIVVTCSVLHHIPDYCRLIRESVELLRPRGMFLSLQDPSRYSTLPIADRLVSASAYYSARLFRSDVIDVFAGIGRFIRRRAGIYH